MYAVSLVSQAIYMTRFILFVSKNDLHGKKLRPTKIFFCNNLNFALLCIFGEDSEFNFAFFIST